MAMVFATVSCQTLDRHTYTGKRRSENYAGSTGIPEKKGGTPGEAGPQSDTALFFCAVNFIGDYDWRRDSSYGNAEAELILYRNFLPQVRIRAGEECCIGAEPGTHHLIGGQLYTEYTSSTHTVIKRNGAEILRYPGREVLKGIVLKEGDLWTLGQDKKGEGFTLRRNGESVFKKNEGKISETSTAARTRGCMRMTGNCVSATVRKATPIQACLRSGTGLRIICRRRRRWFTICSCTVPAPMSCARTKAV